MCQSKAIRGGGTSRWGVRPSPFRGSVAETVERVSFHNNPWAGGVGACLPGFPWRDFYRHSEDRGRRVAMVELLDPGWVRIIDGFSQAARQDVGTAVIFWASILFLFRAQA